MYLKIVIIVFSILITSCSKPTPTVVYIPQKCIIPQIEPPIIDNAKYESYNEIISKALKNYVAMKEYSEKLLEAQKVCE